MPPPNTQTLKEQEHCEPSTIIFKCVVSKNRIWLSMKMKTNQVSSLQNLLISADLLGTGGGCVPLRVGVDDWGDMGEKGTISKMSVEGDLGVTLPAYNKDNKH